MCVAAGKRRWKYQFSLPQIFGHSLNLTVERLAITPAAGGLPRRWSRGQLTYKSSQKSFRKDAQKVHDVNYFAGGFQKKKEKLQGFSFWGEKNPTHLKTVTGKRK